MNRLSAPGYDLFKLLVTIVLAVILILMLLQRSATTPAGTLPLESASTSIPTRSLASPAPLATTIVTRSDDASSPSPVLPATLATEPTPALDSVTATQTTEATSPTPSTPTGASPNVESTGTPSSSENTACDTRVPSRLSVGQQARVAQRLNLRSNPSIEAPIFQTNAVNTVVEIIGGPVCTPVEGRAYLWWQIRLPGGVEGWSAEAQLNEPAYLLQPIQ